MPRASGTRLPLAARAAMRASERIEPTRPSATPVDHDVEQLAMSTLSFQDYVRERMLKKRDAERRAQAADAAATSGQPAADSNERAAADRRSAAARTTGAAARAAGAARGGAGPRRTGARR